jgi:hypothetical protein
MASTDFTGFTTDWTVSTTAGKSWSLPDRTYPQQLRITASHPHNTYIRLYLGIPEKNNQPGSLI